MKFAILAAGEGSRLAQEGVELPKPLVRVNGEAMIDRLIRIFGQNGAEAIYIITNNLTPLTQEHLLQLQAIDKRIHLVVKTTPSSMHSFYELRKLMGNGKFCLTTVDTIFREEEFREYIRAWEQSSEDGLMAVTDYIDDEKPLYIATDSNLTITGFLDHEPQRFISGGIYGLCETSYPVIDKCIAEGQSRMRNFQRQLVKDKLTLKAYPFSKILDVDHASDIEKAEAFLNQQD
ncbi:MAG: NDP-sugar synthase [Bacteroidaceae bacterium]|nr:NDP-sugar synthase [Bacteroidaceae bacterium]